MRLDCALLCRGFAVDGDLITLQGVAWDTAWSETFPGQFSGTIFLRVVFEPAELDTLHTAQLHFVGPAGEVIMPFAAELHAPTLPADWAENQIDLAANNLYGYGIKLNAPGRYSIRIFLDHEPVRELRFLARRGQPAQVRQGAT
jgi:hypothetical protein